MRVLGQRLKAQKSLELEFDIIPLETKAKRGVVFPGPVDIDEWFRDPASRIKYFRERKRIFTDIPMAREADTKASYWPRD